MLKDEFTEKYYEEDNPHNKELFNPAKAALLESPSKMPRINRNLNMTSTKSYVNIPRINKV